MTRPIQTASFRGIIFQMPQSTEEGQRRLVVHEYPNSNAGRRPATNPARDSSAADISIEDLGQGQRQFRVSAFLQGRDTSRADALIAALNNAIPGALHLPWGEQIQAHAQKWSIDKSITRQAIIGFQIQFIEARAVNAPEGAPDKKGGVLQALRDASDAVAVQFGKIYDTVTKPLAVVQSAQAEFADHLARLETFRDFLDNPLGGVVGETLSDSLALAGRIRNLTRPLSNSSINQLSTLLEGFRLTPRQYQNADRSSVGRDEQANAEALALQFNTAMLLGVCDQIVTEGTRAGNPSEYSQIRQDILAQSDRLSPLLEPDLAASLLRQAVGSLGAFIAETHEATSGYETVTAQITEPLIVFTYRRYGADALTQMAEIRARNDLTHQAFIFQNASDKPYYGLSFKRSFLLR